MLLITSIECDRRDAKILSNFKKAFMGYIEQLGEQNRQYQMVQNVLDIEQRMKYLEQNHLINAAGDC